MTETFPWYIFRLLWLPAALVLSSFRREWTGLWDFCRIRPTPQHVSDVVGGVAHVEISDSSMKTQVFLMNKKKQLLVEFQRKLCTSRVQIQIHVPAYPGHQSTQFCFIRIYYSTAIKRKLTFLLFSQSLQSWRQVRFAWEILHVHRLKVKINKYR